MNSVRRQFLSVRLFALLLVILFAFQVRFPPLSYPAIGQLIAVILAAAVLLPLARIAAGAMVESERSALLQRHGALLPGLLFIAWTVARWLMDGAPSDGTATVGTTLWAGAYFVAALVITTTAAPAQTNTQLPNESSSSGRFPRYLLWALCVTGLICGVYAVMQYHWLYKQSYDALLASIGGRAPDRTEAALLHHLNLRRVASFWGDPNSYAAFAALAFASCLELFSLKWKRRLLWQTLAGVSMVAGAVGIFYTGSRGGTLDLLIALGLYGGLAAAMWRHNRGVATALIALLIPLSLFTAPRTVTAQNVSTPTTATIATENTTESGWVWRSDTIRERIYYLEVGAKMIQMAPITGLGPGSINDYFGRLKNPHAREARNLHNWPANIWAELGAIGLLLMLWFLGAVILSIWKRRLWRKPIYRCYCVLFVILLFDGLIQTSWAQRELMCLFGAICGVIVAEAGRVSAISRALVIRRCGGGAAVILAMLIIGIPYLTAASYKQIASDAMLANQPDAALEYLEKATKWAPRDPEPLQARAQMAMAAGQLSVADLFLTQALALNPDSALLHSEAARLAMRMQQPDRAENELQRALELYPSYPAYNMQYARFLQEHGRTDDAITFAERAEKYSFEADEQAEIKAFLNTLYGTKNPPIK